MLHDANVVAADVPVLVDESYWRPQQLPWNFPVGFVSF